jgi:hypothetical protein
MGMLCLYRPLPLGIWAVFTSSTSAALMVSRPVVSARIRPGVSICTAYRRLVREPT